MKSDLTTCTHYNNTIPVQGVRQRNIIGMRHRIMSSCDENINEKCILRPFEIITDNHHGAIVVRLCSEAWFIIIIIIILRLRVL